MNSGRSIETPDKHLIPFDSYKPTTFQRFMETILRTRSSVKKSPDMILVRRFHVTFDVKLLAVKGFMIPARTLGLKLGFFEKPSLPNDGVSWHCAPQNRVRDVVSGVLFMKLLMSCTTLLGSRLPQDSWFQGPCSILLEGQMCESKVLAKFESLGRRLFLSQKMII